VLRAGHQAIPSHVIQSVCVELTRDDSVLDCSDTILLQDVSDIFREPATELAVQDGGDLSFTNELIAHRLVACELEIKPLSHIFEGMTEWPVSKIMQQSGRQSSVFFASVIF
jgi:hypothetical protein